MASANNQHNLTTPRKRKTLKHLKQELKLLLGATSDIPSTKTRASGRRGVMFRDKAHPGETVANTRETLSQNDAKSENLKFEKQLKHLLKSTKPRVRFSDKANIGYTLSHNEAKRETSEIEWELIEQIAALYSTIQQYEKALRSDGNSTHSSRTNNNYFSYFNSRVKKAINGKSRTSRNSTA